MITRWRRAFSRIHITRNLKRSTFYYCSPFLSFFVLPSNGYIFGILTPFKMKLPEVPGTFILACTSPPLPNSRPNARTISARTKQACGKKKKETKYKIPNRRASQQEMQASKLASKARRTKPAASKHINQEQPTKASQPASHQDCGQTQP